MEKIQLSINKTALRNVDAARVQLIFQRLVSNFNGGFGFHNSDDHLMRDYLMTSRNPITLSITDNQDYWDLYYSFLEHPINEQAIKSVRISIETALFEICKILQVDYSPTSICVNACVIRCKELGLGIEDIKEPEAR